MFVYYHTFGCKVNQYETENIRQALETRGFETVRDINNADIYVINSCTVTSQADLKLRQFVHKIRRDNLNGIIVVCGCYTQVMKDHDKVLPEADIIVGASNKTKIAELIEKYIEDKQKVSYICEHKKGDLFEPMFNIGSDNKTRAIIKICLLYTSPSPRDS